ncbi:hypothetical protein [Kitasatospora sp. NPDC093102]|uniref:hypothetical protein n=1 Tax=Kitasatospora sp. NPDC093102 TaxID=3155069 RepID=UPI0034418740
MPERERQGEPGWARQRGHGWCSTSSDLAPEPALLFKAEHVRRKDQTDFDTTVPLMTSAQRDTLAELLARVHPGHPWITAL